MAPNLLATVFKTQIGNGKVSDLSVGDGGDGGGNSVRVRERERRGDILLPRSTMFTHLTTFKANNKCEFHQV